MEHTKQDKQAYFKGLRDRWNEAKKLLTAGKIKEIEAIIATHGMNISQTGFMCVMMQLNEQGLDGLPYLDAKTFPGWKENGFQVRKGERSTLSGITWIGAKGKEKTEDQDKKSGFMFPKEYKLFHRSQVEAMHPIDDRIKTPRNPIVSTKKPQSNAKFLSMADTLTSQIEHKCRPMTQNPTPKRNREYNGRLWEGDNLSRLQKLLFVIADCIEKETLPEILQGITKKADIAKLVYKGSDSSQGYYSCIPNENYFLTTPEALAAQQLIEGNREEEKEQQEANEIAKMKQSLLLQKIDDFFPTPDAVIERMVKLLDIGFGHRILEPSAGMGNILEYLPAGTIAIEQNFSLFEYLQKTQPQNSILQGDFLSMNGEIGMFDRIIMNPPFTKGADIKHIKYALEHLNEGGKLVALCAGGPNQARELMPLADLWEDLPQGSFKQAGTMVNACIMVVDC